MPDLTDLLRSAGILLIVYFLFRMQTRRSQRRKSAERAEGRAAEPLGKSGDGKADKAAAGPSRQGADQLGLALEETARDALAEVQTKIVVLQQLIVDANAAAERLEAALRETESRQPGSMV